MTELKAGEVLEDARPLRLGPARRWQDGPVLNRELGAATAKEGDASRR